MARCWKAQAPRQQSVAPDAGRRAQRRGPVQPDLAGPDGKQRVVFAKNWAYLSGQASNTDLSFPGLDPSADRTYVSNGWGVTKSVYSNRIRKDNAA